MIQNYRRVAAMSTTCRNTSFGGLSRPSGTSPLHFLQTTDTRPPDFSSTMRVGTRSTPSLSGGRATAPPQFGQVSLMLPPQGHLASPS
jgi:hypothetical protein